MIIVPSFIYDKVILFHIRSYLVFDSNSGISSSIFERNSFWDSRFSIFINYFGNKTSKISQSESIRNSVQISYDSLKMIHVYTIILNIT